MGATEDAGSISSELLQLKKQVDLLEGLCGDNFSEAAVKAAARDIRKHIDQIAKLVTED
jgi:hypothetical protein